MLGDHPHDPLTHRGLNLLRHLHILLNSERCGMKPRAIQVDQHTAKKVRITIHGKDNYQLDGDVVGEATTLFAEIQPGALAICVPAQAASEPQQ
jgi:diacylglycerol kinase family enzyme